MRSQIKDYYSILEVSPVATITEIKKSYRKLAFKYHPDTNPDNTFAIAMFREVQEAYAILSDNTKRSKYDEERWLSGMSSRAKDQIVITPQWIHNECRKLQAHMMAVDTYRMDHRALNDYIMLLLSDKHLAILKQKEDATFNRQIAQLLLSASRNIRHPYMEYIAERLRLLVINDEIFLQKLELQVKDSRLAANRVKYMPYIILIVTLVLCVIMYIWVNG
jgi:molecular chaperone DnaJ